VTERGEVVEEGLLFSFRLLDDFRLGIEVLLAFEGRGNVPAKALDEGAHLAFKRRALPGRKRETGLARRVLKVVDITPVGWSRRRLGQPLHHLPHECALPGPDRPGDEDVEAGALHLKAEVQGLDRPLLPDRVIERFDLARIIESQAVGVHLRSQQTGGNLLFVRHRRGSYTSSAWGG
jgi:hypothetical protein